MASVLRTPFLQIHIRPLQPRAPSESSKPFWVSFRQNNRTQKPSRFTLNTLRFSPLPSLSLVKFLTFASQGEAESIATEEVQEPPAEDSLDHTVAVDDSTSDEAESESIDGVGDDTDEEPVSAIIASLQSYKEALANNDESKITEIEPFFKSIEDEKIGLEKRVASLSEELSMAKERVLRVSADFDNFRKRTDRERISLVTNAQGELIENFLPVLDNFERAKAQIKIETEAEQKISNSYQSIYKQFMEILSSLGVVPVEPVGQPFDPMLHEAIMREESEESKEGIIIEEFRKGFKLGDRLLRPSMVKVSAGPGPSKPKEVLLSEGQDANENDKEDSIDDESQESESS